MKDKEINAGYEIIERFSVGEQGLQSDTVKQHPRRMSHGSLGLPTKTISFGGITQEQR